MNMRPEYDFTVIENRRAWKRNAIEVAPARTTTKLNLGGWNR